MARIRYSTSDDLLHAPVTPQEVDAYLSARGRPLLARDAIRHFLYRTRVTLSAADSANHNLRKALEKANETKRRVGAPTTLSPMDAVRFASPEEISAVVGHLNSSLLNSLQKNVSESRALREALASDLAAVRSASQQMASRNDLPATVRAEFVKLLNALPETPAEVQKPKALELGEMSGLIEVTTPAPAAAPVALPEATDGPNPAAGYLTTSQLPAYLGPPPFTPGPGLVR